MTAADAIDRIAQRVCAETGATLVKAERWQEKRGTWLYFELDGYQHQILEMDYFVEDHGEDLAVKLMVHGLRNPQMELKKIERR